MRITVDFIAGLWIGILCAWADIKIADFFVKREIKRKANK